MIPDDKGRTDEEIIREHFYGYVVAKDLRKALDQARDLDIHELWSLYSELGTVRDALINPLIGKVVEEYMRAQEEAQKRAKREAKKHPRRRGPHDGGSASGAGGTP